MIEEAARAFRASSLALFTAAGLVASGNGAFALSQEAAIESCRERVGKPRVQACVRNMVQSRGGPGMQYVEQCRAPVKPLVQACVRAALMKANARPDVPLALDIKKDEASTEGALKAGFVAPPRTIADITSILSSEKPDPVRLAERQAAAAKEPPKNASKEALATFYLERAVARAELGQVEEATSDSKQVIALGGDVRRVARARLVLSNQLLGRGDTASALAVLDEQLRAVDRPGSKGFVFPTLLTMISVSTKSGDIARAEAYVRRLEALLKEARTSGLPAWRKSYARFGKSWEATTESARGILYESRGQLREAEAAYLKTAQWQSAIKAEQDDKDDDDDSGPSDSKIESGMDKTTAALARIRLAMGRLSEGEADARRALLSRIKDRGVYHSSTVPFIGALAAQLIEQGRYAEAEKLIRATRDVEKTIGIAGDHPTAVYRLAQLGSALNYQGKFQDAIEIYAELDRVTAKWDPARKDRLGFAGSRVSSLYAAGQIAEGFQLATDQLAKAEARFGPRSNQAAIMHGYVAIGHMRAGRYDDAANEFKITIPLLSDAARETSMDESAGDVGALTARLQNIVETYIAMLARTRQDDAGIAAETFSLADSVRGRVVQSALNATNARSAAADPALAEVIRKEQDLTQTIAAQQATLNNALAAETRDDKAVRATMSLLDRSRGDLAELRRDIAKRFPSYAELINPKPPSVAQVQASLKSDEAMVSFYFGKRNAFVWAVPKDGKATFASIAMTPGEIETAIRSLRTSLEPNAAMISEIPEFDLGLAYRLYQALLQPVEPGWKNAKNLVLITNGVLGLLPASLLPVEAAKLDPNEKTLFESYRDVKWLARTHAVTMVPSSSALLSLRRLPKGREGREALMAYGDPIFSTQQAEQAAQAKDEQDKARVAEAATTMRGAPLKRRNAPQLDGVDSAELAQLPRLPDTADELTSIAAALRADPAKSVFLGKDANEASIKRADLSGYKVLAFATHGLVPGELNGLTQPALALSAPAVAGAKDGDGLLTMEEILALKLDADWVVLSACNTGAGSGAGAEAASGLGRAFFYAGTRALLVTNWSVHSQSARELVTDLFKRQADDAALPRGEAMRRAMMAMVDGAGYKNEAGETEFAYAHPLFWAPYTIIGDTGGM